jgi:hypothetical protein
MFKHAVRVSYVLMVVLLLSMSVSLAQECPDLQDLAL